MPYAGDESIGILPGPEVAKVKMMNYNHLYYFHVIAQEGTIARASKRLNLSQPTISEQLKRLEEYFGVKFFDRHAGALRLNHNGQRALEYTQTIFDTAKRLSDAFERGPDPAKTRLEVGIVTSAARSTAADRLITLFDEEDLLVRVRNGDNRFLLHELVSSGLDVLITDVLPTQSKEKGVEARIISNIDLVFVASTEFLDKTEGDLPNLLHGREFIHYTEQSSYRWQIDSFLAEHNVEPKFVAEADDVYIVHNAISKSLCIGVLPRSVLAEEQAENLVILGEVGDSPKLYALYNHKNPTEETMRALEVLAPEQLAGT